MQQQSLFMTGTTPAVQFLLKKSAKEAELKAASALPSIAAATDDEAARATTAKRQHDEEGDEWNPDDSSDDGSAKKKRVKKVKKSPVKPKEKGPNQATTATTTTTTTTGATRKRKAPPSSANNSTTDEKFTAMVTAYTAFLTQHGPNAIMTTKLTQTDPTYPTLARWLLATKGEYSKLRRGLHSTLTIPRLVQLIDANFPFPKDATTLSHRGHTISWDDRIQQCQHFRTEHGHLQIKGAHPVLGTWSDTMRKYKTRKTNGQKTPLTDDRERQLTELGFVWGIHPKKTTPTVSFDERLVQFTAYLHDQGHPYPPQSLPHPVGLGRWVAEQRREYKIMVQTQQATAGDPAVRNNNKRISMTPERALRLTTAGFQWDASHIRRTPKVKHEDEGDETTTTSPTNKKSRKRAALPLHDDTERNGFPNTLPQPQYRHYHRVQQPAKLTKDYNPNRPWDKYHV